MSGKRHKKELWLDPRAKLFLILMCVLSSMFAPSLAYQFILVMLIAILGAFFGKWKYVIKAVCFYAVICALTVWIMAEMTGTLRTMFIAFLGLLDVYKRQYMKCFRKTFQHHLFGIVNRTILITQDCGSCNSHLLCNIRPVSYTHLPCAA